MFFVKYSGTFGYIKPWTAVRDGETYSQQFLTPSIVEGMEKKLFPALLDAAFQGKIVKIKRHRLNYQSLDVQQEKTWSKGGLVISKDKNVYKTNHGVLKRGILINPNLYLGFEQQADAEIAFQQSICLCRNEDILLPELMLELSESDFDEQIGGFELLFADAETGFKVGHNRFDNASEMFGILKIFNQPIRTEP